VIDNPVLRRELIDRLRSGKTLGSLLVVAIVTSSIVLLRWPASATVDLVSRGSAEVFQPLAWGIAAAIVMLVPAFPATSIVREKQRGTLALLLHSPIGPLSIWIGKFFGNIVLMVVLIAASIPAMAACYSMGGTSLTQHIIPLYLIFFVMAVMYTSVGLWISSYQTSPDASLRWTYAAVIGLAALSLAPNVVLTGKTSLFAQFAEYLSYLSPIPALYQLTGSNDISLQAMRSTATKGFLVSASILSIIMALMTLYRLQPKLLDVSKSAGKVTEQRSSGIQWLRRFLFLIDPDRRTSGIPFLVNPVMVKEFRTRKFGRLHWLLRLVAVCAVISLGLTVVAASGTVSWGVERIAAVMVLLQLSLLLLLGPSLASGLISGEIESGGWQLLRVTPLSSSRILVGKLMSVVWTMLLVLMATLPGYVVMVYIQPALESQVLRVLISLGISALLVVLVTACISSLMSKTAVATATSYGVLFSLFAGTLLVWLARGKPFGKQFVETTLMFNPAAVALAEMRVSGMEDLNLIPWAWWIALAICFLATCVLSIRVWRLTCPD
jgi:ABC-type transport system involved in multi-copper enzyme maturation permease subunit